MERYYFLGFLGFSPYRFNGIFDNEPLNYKYIPSPNAVKLKINASGYIKNNDMLKISSSVYLTVPRYLLNMCAGFNVDNLLIFIYYNDNYPDDNTDSCIFGEVGSKCDYKLIDIDLKHKTFKECDDSVNVMDIYNKFLLRNVNDELYEPVKDYIEDMFYKYKKRCSEDRVAINDFNSTDKTIDIYMIRDLVLNSFIEKDEHRVIERTGRPVVCFNPYTSMMYMFKGDFFPNIVYGFMYGIYHYAFLFGNIPELLWGAFVRGRDSYIYRLNELGDMIFHNISIGSVLANPFLDVEFNVVDGETDVSTVWSVNFGEAKVKEISNQYNIIDKVFQLVMEKKIKDFEDFIKQILDKDGAEFREKIVDEVKDIVFKGNIGVL